MFERIQADNIQMIKEGSIFDNLIHDTILLVVIRCIGTLLIY